MGSRECRKSLSVIVEIDTHLPEGLTNSRTPLVALRNRDRGQRNSAELLQLLYASASLVP